VRALRPRRLSPAHRGPTHDGSGRPAPSTRLLGEQPLTVSIDLRFGAVKVRWSRLPERERWMSSSGKRPPASARRFAALRVPRRRSRRRRTRIARSTLHRGLSSDDMPFGAGWRGPRVNVRYARSAPSARRSREGRAAGGGSVWMAAPGGAVLRSWIMSIVLTCGCGGRVGGGASRRDLRRAIGACGTVWCRRRAGRTRAERNAATARVRAHQVRR
jgi:hypothetical protein